MPPDIRRANVPIYAMSAELTVLVLVIAALRKKPEFTVARTVRNNYIKFPESELPILDGADEHPVIR